jgi:hypothetical protein
MGCLRIENRGDRYLQVSGLSFDDAGRRQEIALSGRVLAGAWKQFAFPLPRNASIPQHLEVASSAGPIAVGSPGAQ